MGNVKKARYLCMEPNCDKKYVNGDAIRKHANKYHKKWIKDKTPSEYSFEIPEEYEGNDYVTDFMKMVKDILDDEKLNSVKEPLISTSGKYSIFFSPPSLTGQYP